MDASTASLQRFGQAEPLVVHAGTGRVIGGNGWLAAMRKLSWTECDVVEPCAPPAQSVSRLGDLWVLGDHRLLRGDSTDATSFTLVLEGKRADLTGTDPTNGVR